jgi:hypothetical protein
MSGKPYAPKSSDLDLEGFIAQVQTLINNPKYLPLTVEGAKEILESIKEVLYPLHIKITYETLSCLDKVEKARNDFKNKDRLEHVVFDGATSLTQLVPRFRLLLATNRYKADFRVPLVRQSNGLILEIYEDFGTETQLSAEQKKTGKVEVANDGVELLDDLDEPPVKQEVGLLGEPGQPGTRGTNCPEPGPCGPASKLKCRALVIPPNDFNPNFVHTQVGKAVDEGKYDVYEINDGTTFSVYYDPHILTSSNVTRVVTTDKGEELKTFKVYKVGKWMRSTKNAFDINELVWRGHSYQAVIDDVLKQYPNFVVEKLDKNCIYSIGLKHPAFHPFGQPREWLASDFTTPREGEKWLRSAWLIQVADRSLHTQNESPMPEVGLPRQEKIKAKISFHDMLQKSEVALEAFLNNPTHPAFFGYFLRSSGVADEPDILLESSLWNMIRHMIYQLPYIPNKMVREKQEQNFKNMRFVILDAFLDFKKRDTFIKLFPQFTTQHQEYSTMVDKLVDGVYESLSSTKKESDLVEILEDTAEERQLNLLIGRFVPIVKDQYQPQEQKLPPRAVGKNPKKPEKNYDKKVIRTLVLNPRHADIYFQILGV